MKNKLVAIIFLFSISILIYKNWFFSTNIIGGDWPYFFPEAVTAFSFPLAAWDATYGNGLGGTHIVYALDSYLVFTGWFFSNVLHLPWNIVYKIFWFGLFLFSSLFSIRTLLKLFFPKLPSIYQAIAMLLYSANTYVLLMVSGGQMGIALGYSIAPWVFASFVKSIQASQQSFSVYDLKQAIRSGLLFAILVLFDLRVAYILMLAVFLYMLCIVIYTLSKRTMITRCFLLLFSIGIPLGITGLLHAFWIIPTVLSHNNPLNDLGSAYTSVSSLKFFSFATFSNAFGLLHPNWPDNIFGKISFMKPEFFILPILAYSSLIFISPSKKDTLHKFSETSAILFFALLGLLGIFLAKGANEPFGQIFIFLFQKIPGFIMFRDPTKFYWLVCVAYSVLIPISIFSFYNRIKTNIPMFAKNKIFNFQNMFLFSILFCLLFLVRQALLGQIDGTFSQRSVANEYIQLKDTLSREPHFYRTLWMPQKQRFAFASATHPAIEAGTLFSATDEAGLLRKFHNPATKDYLAKLSVKDIIIPYDPYGEIFIADRKYSEKKRIEFEKALDTVSWLKKITTGKITIYQTERYKDLFSFIDTSNTVSYIVKSPTHYVLTLDIQQPGTLVFSQNYSPYWKATMQNNEQASIMTKEKLNSFLLHTIGKYKIDIYYSSEKYYTIGRVISFITLVLVGILLIKKQKKDEI